MGPPAGQNARPTTRRAGAAVVLAFGGVVSGLGAYAFQLIAARTLGPARLAPIGVLWTVQYLITAVVLFGLEAYTASGEGGSAGGHRALGRPLHWILVTAAVGMGGTFLLRERLFPEDPLLVLSAGASALLYGGFATARGRLAATGHTARYALATAFEGAGRMTAGVAAALAWPTVGAFAAAMPLGPLAALPFLWDRTGGRASAVPSRQPRHLVPSVLASNAFGHALVAGAPIAAVLASASATEVATIFLVTSFARVPLVLAFNGLLPRLIPMAQRLEQNGADARLPDLTAGLARTAIALAVPAGLCGWFLGPWFVRIMFGADYAAHPPLIAGAAATSILATAAFASGYVLIGRQRHRAQPVPWAAGLTSAALVLAIPWAPILLRTAVAMPAGALVALMGLTRANHADADASPGKRPTPGPPTAHP